MLAALTLATGAQTPLRFQQHARGPEPAQPTLGRRPARRARRCPACPRRPERCRARSQRSLQPRHDHPHETRKSPPPCLARAADRPRMGPARPGRARIGRSSPRAAREPPVERLDAVRSRARVPRGTRDHRRRGVAVRVRVHGHREPSVADGAGRVSGDLSDLPRASAGAMILGSVPRAKASAAVAASCLRVRAVPRAERRRSARSPARRRGRCTTLCQVAPFSLLLRRIPSRPCSVNPVPLIRCSRTASST